MSVCLALFIFFSFSRLRLMNCFSACHKLRLGKHFDFLSSHLFSAFKLYLPLAIIYLRLYLKCHGDVKKVEQAIRHLCRDYYLTPCHVRHL